MIGGIYGAYSPYGAYGAYGASAARSGREGAAVQPSRGAAAVLSVRRAAAPETPVQPVPPAKPVNGETSAALPFFRLGADPAEMAVRMRIQYPGAPEEEEEGSDPAKGADLGAEGVQKAAREGECQTCKERKYQDGSDDAGVSFKTPTRIDPDQAASAVRGHEMEHVVREQAKARREDRRVVSQTVTYHTAICPECGRAYVSGGTTRTVTASKPEQVQEDGGDQGEAA